MSVEILTAIAFQNDFPGRMNEIEKAGIQRSITGTIRKLTRPEVLGMAVRHAWPGPGRRSPDTTRTRGLRDGPRLPLRGYLGSLTGVATKHLNNFKPENSDLKPQNNKMVFTGRTKNASSTKHYSAYSPTYQKINSE